MASDERANFLAAQAVSHTETYLNDRLTQVGLAQAADTLMRDLFLTPSANLSETTRLLVIAMQRTAVASGPREDRWRDVLRALCRLVRHESLAATGGAGS